MTMPEANRRILFISALSIAIALGATLIAQFLARLIGLITNIAFYGRLDTAFVQPGDAPHWGPWVIIVPVIGGIIVGYMARYGSKAIRGHGIPEAMENILLNQSRIPARMTLLKPISAAIAIGTGGPFGAEGPIIATGGALGSLVGQLVRTTAAERKVLLAAGAAAGMTATFGSPVSAVLLAIELLVFEFRPSSFVPVALASATAAGARIPFAGLEPAFAMPPITEMQGSSIAFYILLGAVMGLVSVIVTKAVYWVEDLFEELPIHWMWWPALGGIAVGVIGYFFPRTLGVGYTNITAILAGRWTLAVVAGFCLMKFLSWVIALGSGTSGGTLAPLFSIGGALGLVIGTAGTALFPLGGIDPKVAALVGMASIFAGASRAALTSIVFAFEVTQQPFGLLPLLGGCAASFLVSWLLMKNSIMTEKIVRRGVKVPAEYEPDYLDQVHVRDFHSKQVRTLPAEATIAELRDRLRTEPEAFRHQAYPLVRKDGELAGMTTVREILRAADPAMPVLQLCPRAPIVVFPYNTLREAADLMIENDIGRLPVVAAGEPTKVTGIITRSDVFGAHRPRLKQDATSEVHIRLGMRELKMFPKI